MRPRLLDLFCGAGGAAMGYHHAGFDIVGVDLAPQPRYPFEFVQADALEYPLDGYDAIHASPPCQAYSRATLAQRNGGNAYPDLLALTRDRLNTTGVPWVIENVPGAPMRPDFKLCGCIFGLELRRERWFETSWHAFDLRLGCHHPHPVVSVVGHDSPSSVRTAWRQHHGRNPSINDYRAAMGIDWMTGDELSQAIPPAYTQHIGHYLLNAIRHQQDEVIVDRVELVANAAS
jgi:DNA (cytosine-5)-methyltransferase 1